MLYDDPHRWGFTFQANAQMTLAKLHAKPTKAPVKVMESSNDSCHLDLIIYLRATPETCLQRIQTRHRSGEESISLDYLQTLHERHEEWLIHRNRTNLSIPILIVDANQTKERVYNDTNTHVENLISC
ncbi:unnamed protein product [Rotaria sp. Silwood2]|nr:unnamed protein product [Rotaria sp. Silwood2]CAF4542936.1 unnamed protein product [Rotaria sp. Silwood2]